MYEVHSSNYLPKDCVNDSVAVKTSLHLKMMASTTRGTAELKASVGESS